MSTSITSECLDNVFLSLLQKLYLALDPVPGDVIEFDLKPDGRVGVLVYPKEWRPTLCFRRLFSALGLPVRTEDIFWSLLRTIPAERHAVRLTSNGAISIFFKTDFPAIGIAPLLEALRLDEKGTPISPFFTNLGKPSCGLALELNVQGCPRMRFYHMIHDQNELEEALCSSVALYGIGNMPMLLELLNEMNPFQSSCGHLVLNLGSGPLGSSIKLEIPDVLVDRIPSSLPLTENEYIYWEKAACLAHHMESERFPYLGIRLSRGRERELTFYIDARKAADDAFSRD